MTKRLILTAIAFSLAILLIPNAITKAGENITAVLSLQQAESTVGDPIQLILQVTHQDNQHVILPQLETDWGGMTVYSQSPGTTELNPDGTKTTSQVIDVRLFSPGEFSTPPLPITVSDENGQLAEITADPISITITSVLLEGDTQLRDIKPQAELPYFNLITWITILGILLVTAVVVVIFWLRKKRALAGRLIDNRLPHEVALDELERVESLDLTALGRFKEHYTLVSDCIRTYVESTQHIPMIERTTGEIKRSLKHTQLTQDEAKQLVGLLEESDLVKFSKFTPDAESARNIVQKSRVFVLQTKPADVNETSEDKGSPKSISSDQNYGAGRRSTQAEVSA